MQAEYITLLGICVQTALYLLAGFALVVRADASAKNLKEEVTEMKNELKTLANVIVVQAVQTTRLDNLATQVVQQGKTIEELRRGTGFINNRGARSVDGEY